jgi:hypothetical protein
MPTKTPRRSNIGMPSPKPTPRPTFIAVSLCLESDELAVLLAEGVEEVEVVGRLVASAVLVALVVGGIDVVAAFSLMLK